MRFRRWASGFRHWKAYRKVLARLRELERDDPDVKANSTSKADLTWIGEGQDAADLLARACHRYRDRPCLAWREPHSDYRSITYGQLWRRVLALAEGLSREGWVQPGSLVGICGFSGLEWIIADLACLYVGAVSVPLDSAIRVEDLAHVLRQTELGCFIAELPSLLRLSGTLRESSSLRAVVAIPPVEGERPRALDLDIRWGWLDHVESAARGAVSASPAQPHDLFSIVYTSGSTGPPKGVMLTHGRWTETLKASLRRAAVPRLTVGCLPLSHIGGRTNLYSTMMGGGCVSMVSKSDMSSLLDDVARARPTHLFLVPRVSGLLYQQFQLEMQRHGRFRGELEAMLDDPIGQQVCRTLRRELLGGRLCFVHVGTAPTPPEVMRFLWRGLKVHVTDLYGSTEGGPLAVNGKVHDFVKHRLVDRPELGFTTLDKPHPRGELAVISPRASSGYYNDPEATDALFHQGFLLTGDIVQEVSPGQLVWLDRCQSVLRLPQGEFVNVSRLEDLFCAESPLIAQCYLHGDARHPHLLAVLVPSADLLETTPEITRQRDLLRQELGRVAATSGLRGLEVPRDFFLEPQPFSVQNGLISSTGKPRRPQLKRAYTERLEALYAKMEERMRVKLSDVALSAEDRLRDAVTLTLGIEPPDLQVSFTQLGGDSVSALRLSDLLTQVCGRKVEVAKLLDPTAPLQELLEMVAPSETSIESVHGKDAVWANPADLSKLLRQPDANRESLPKKLLAPHTVLLTGANGFLGRFLALELASRLPANGRVVALVRGPSSRLRESYASSQGRQAFGAAEGRIEVLSGDLTQPRLGLDHSVWERLGDEVGAILHCGALVNHTLSYAHLFESNVSATAEVIALAQHIGRGKTIHFVSTVALGAGRYGRNPASESETANQLWARRAIDDQPGSYAQGYTTSKWAAEILLQEAHRRSGLPVTVSRCGLLLPHAIWPGESNPRDMLSRLLYGLYRTRLAPATVGSPQDLDGLPVDLVAGFLAALTCEPTEGFSIYHLCQSEATGLSPDTIVQRAAEIWGCQTLPPNEFWSLFRRRLAELPGEDQRLSPLAILDRWERGGYGALRLQSTAFQQRLGELCPERGDTRLHPDYLDSRLLAWLLSQASEELS